MRFFIFPLLILAVACGKNSSTTSGPLGLGSSLNTTTYNDGLSDGLGVDMLDITLDIPVDISGDEILFRRNDSDAQKGRRTTCEMAVKENESMKFNLVGPHSLELFMPNGDKMTMTRASVDNNGVMGSWRWKGYEGDTYKIKRMTILNMNRVIFNVHCEK